MQAGIHLFVEKPISVKSAEEVARLAKELGKLQEERGLVIAVGYMLRYSPAIQVRILFCLMDGIKLQLVLVKKGLHCSD